MRKAINELKVGDKIWYIEIDSRYKRELQESTVVKITSKYIYIKDLGQFTKVNKNTLRDKTTTGWGYTIQCYLHPNDYYDLIEYNKLRQDIIKLLNENKAKLPLHQMRTIYEKLAQSKETYEIWGKPNEI